MARLPPLPLARAPRDPLPLLAFPRVTLFAGGACSLTTIALALLALAVLRFFALLAFLPAF